MVLGCDGVREQQRTKWSFVTMPTASAGLTETFFQVNQRLSDDKSDRGKVPARKSRRRKILILKSTISDGSDEQFSQHSLPYLCPTVKFSVCGSVFIQD